MRLEEVRDAFELWRAHRVKREPIPEALWLMVQTLLPHYKKSEITETLRMNSAQLESGCQKKPSFDRTEQSGFAVGELHHPHFMMQRQQACQRCELTLKGKRKSLQISINISQLSHVLPLMEDYL